ncbi:helix-turn-helix domain-containing protein [Candidatus Gracilibacteria bacterium]|nr:helix-turn-helix domain-containing protein [Candidatus Gracilibacteria bacterium]
MLIKANSDIIRSGTIGQHLKNVIEQKSFTVSEVAEKMGISQPALSRVLNGKVGGSDNFFTKASRAIGLSTKEMQEIFKAADQEEYKYKYGEEIISGEIDIETLSDEDLEDVLLSKNGIISEEAQKDLKSYIAFLRTKYPKK